MSKINTYRCPMCERRYALTSDKAYRVNVYAAPGKGRPRLCSDDCRKLAAYVRAAQPARVYLATFTTAKLRRVRLAIDTGRPVRF